MALIYTFSTFSAAIITFILTDVIRKFSLSRKIVAVPRERDFHKKPVPRLGGVAIFVGIILTLIFIYLVNPEILSFSDETRFGIDRRFLGIVIGSIFITAIGICDDLKNLKPTKQFFYQFIAASIVVLFGIGIDFIRSPLGEIRLDQWTFNLFNFSGYHFSITLWSDLFTLIWLIVIMNVVNWLDGLDGLAAGVSCIAALMLFVLTILIGGNIATAVLAVVLFGSLLGFLPWNWHPAKIFMGSAGSFLLGYILGILAIVSGGKLATAILVLGIPVFDALAVALRRILKGKSPFIGDRTHLHHRLIDAGFSVRVTVVLIYVFAAFFGLLALIDANATAKLVMLIWVVAVLMILGTITYVLEMRNGKKIK